LIGLGDVEERVIGARPPEKVGEARGHLELLTERRWRSPTGQASFDAIEKIGRLEERLESQRDASAKLLPSGAVLPVLYTLKNVVLSAAVSGRLKARRPNAVMNC